MVEDDLVIPNCCLNEVNDVSISLVKEKDLIIKRGTLVMALVRKSLTKSKLNSFKIWGDIRGIPVRRAFSGVRETLMMEHSGFAGSRKNSLEGFVVGLRV